MRNTDFIEAIIQLYYNSSKIRLANSTLGLLGNIASLVVFSRPRLKKLSISIYIRALSITYICVNLNSLRTSITNIYVWYEFTEYSEFTCKFFRYILRLPIPVSAWFEVLATIDRFLVILYSARYKLLLTRFRFLGQTALLIVIVFQMIVFSSEIFFLKLEQIKNGSTMVFCTNNGDKPNINHAKLIESIDLVLLPFILMLSFSVATIWGIVKSRRNSHNSTNNLATSRLKARDIKFGITLICINLIFLMLNAPLRFLNIFHFVENVINNPFNNLVYLYITSTALDFQYSSCFFIQLAVNSLVRREFLELCKLFLNPFIRFFLLLKISTIRSRS